MPTDSRPKTVSPGLEGRGAEGWEGGGTMDVLLFLILIGVILWATGHLILH